MLPSVHLDHEPSLQACEVDDIGTHRDLAAEGVAVHLLGAQVKPEADLRVGPCVPSPGKIICIGLNYRRHAEETHAPVPKTPILFSKFDNALAACGDEVPLPEVAQQYDYEAELGVVIGRRAHRVTE